MSRITRMNAVLIGLASLLAWQVAPTPAQAGFWGQLLKMSGLEPGAGNAQHRATVAAKQEAAKPEAPRDATLDGRLVDLREFITGEHSSSDHVKCTAEAIKAGKPLALESPHGLVLIGRSAAVDSSKLVPWACQEVEVKGKLYDMDGLRYMEVTSIGKPQPMAQASATKGAVSTRPSAAANEKPTSPGHADQTSAHHAK